MRYADYLKTLDDREEYRRAEDELGVHFALGRAVVSARIGRGWSQAELAERVGTKQANISHIESGLANPTLRLAQKITRALGMEIRFVELGDRRESQVSVQTRDILPIAVPNWPIRTRWEQQAVRSTNRPTAKEI
jgi:transcriptional regulator with XRE-family HTH domain